MSFVPRKSVSGFNAAGPWILNPPCPSPVVTDVRGLLDPGEDYDNVNGGVDPSIYPAGASMAVPTAYKLVVPENTYGSPNDHLNGDHLLRLRQNSLALVAGGYLGTWTASTRVRSDTWVLSYTLHEDYNFLRAEWHLMALATFGTFRWSGGFRFYLLQAEDCKNEILSETNASTHEFDALGRNVFRYSQDGGFEDFTNLTVEPWYA